MEQRLYDPDKPPDWLEPSWWADTPNCDHLAHPAGVHRARIDAVANLAFELFQLGLVSSAVDMGAGDGALLWRLNGMAVGDLAGRTWGYEIIKDSVRVARDERQVDVRLGHVTEGYADVRDVRKPIRWADLVICTEMLEHLADPHAWAATMARHATGAGWLTVSSPWKETEYQHESNHAWCWDLAGYRAMLEGAGWHVVAQHQVEWSQVVLACRLSGGKGMLERAREAAADDRWHDPVFEGRFEPNAIAQSVRPE